MGVRIPVVAVVGHKKSGKTLIIEGIVRGLIEEGLRVATAKHISQKSFSMDTKGKDTWRHAEAGANPVIAVSDREISILLKDGVQSLTLDYLFKFISDADVILLEGFSTLILNEKKIGKILCVRDRGEYEEYKEKTSGETIAFCSLEPLGEPILRIREEQSILINQTLNFIRRERSILEILSQLPGLDCRKCGRTSCEELAEDIYAGKANINDCLPLKHKTELKTEITIGEKSIPLQPFVSEIIRNSVLGMISTLKGTSIKGNERLHIKISE